MQPTGFASDGRNLSNVANRHQESKSHMTCHASYKLLGNVDVASALDEARQREILRHNENASRYSKMMKHHIDVAVYLSAQGLAFRGHSEDKFSPNRGNFIELMDLLGNYSQELRVFLDKERISYTSHDPQNELIKCIFQEVQNEIRNRVSASRCLSVMMDDTSDLSNTEQSAVSVRLIHDGNVEEHLLGLTHASDDQSADGLTKIMIKILGSYNVTPETGKRKLIGQSYDGAATMSGELNGVQKRMRDYFPLAYYNHCVAHRMSLCASQSSMKIPEVAKFFGILDKLITFFRSSPKRTRYLGYNLPKPGDTRWLSRDTAITAIDSCYETIGTVLYQMSSNGREKVDTQTTARGLLANIQNVDFLCLLKLYRKIFEHCTPIITVMQKPTLDAVQLRSMLDDFQRFLAALSFEDIWQITLDADPSFPVERARAGWRGRETHNNGSEDAWKEKLSIVASKVCIEFSGQISWRFENLKKFKWMDLIHPAKFAENVKRPPNEIKELIREFGDLYPFAVHDINSVEHNLEVLYNNHEISLLLRKCANERNRAMKQRRARHRSNKASHREESSSGDQVMEEVIDVEEIDEFEIRESTGLEGDIAHGETLSMQDLLTVIHSTDLADALPQAMVLLEVAAVTPLTSVHCERVFSRMKRVISESRSRMLQERKEHLVFLQVEHGTLRSLAKQPTFYQNVVSRFRESNQRRLERFSRK